MGRVNMAQLIFLFCYTETFPRSTFLRRSSNDLIPLKILKDFPPKRAPEMNGKEYYRMVKYHVCFVG